MDDRNEEPMEGAYDEAELSDDEFKELNFDDLVDRVESNDPSLTSVKVSTRILIPNLDETLIQNDDDVCRHRLERFSKAIGRNTHLKALMIDGRSVRLGEAQVTSLFHGIACNQSIKRFHFNCCGLFVRKACHILTPLFKNNQVERIRIHACTMSLERTRLLATSLAEFDSLKEFALTCSSKFRDDSDSRQVVRELIQALSCHSRLKKLKLSYTNLGKLGCSVLVDLLKNPNISLRVLDLTSNNLGDTEAVALASGIAGNVSLKEIDFAFNSGITQAGWLAIFGALSSSGCRVEKLTLEYNEIHDAVPFNRRILQAGWQPLFSFLCSSICRLKKLSLRNNEINDATAQSLSTALTSSTPIKTLNLGYIRGITLTGWRVLVESLRSPTCVLEDLDLSGNQLNDEVMDSLTGALASNRSLKVLNLSSNHGFTGAAWQKFFSTVLTNPSSELEKLYLGCCDTSNDAILALTNALLDNTKLKVLDLCNHHITDAGWAMFCSVLDSPSTALEELRLDGNEMNDATLTSMMNSLAKNEKLKKLMLDHRSADWEHPMSLLCNADSIMGTYNSNHTLEELGYEGYEDVYEDVLNVPLPEELESMLRINRENSPSQAAQLKIIKTHFNEGFITQPFVGMDLNVLPHAMACMGRDGRAGDVNGHYFSFIKSISSLFKNVNW